MLNEIKAGDIISIYFTNGVEIVAEYVNATTNNITVKKPLKIFVENDQDGTVKIGVFMLGHDPEKELKVNKDLIIAYSKTHSLLEKDYHDMTKGQ